MSQRERRAIAELPGSSEEAIEQRQESRRRHDRARAEREARAQAVAHPSGALVSGRRAFLRGAGGLTLSLPFFEMLAPRRAQAAPMAPKRFLLWHQPQGTQYDQWALPGSSPTDFSLGKILQPIAPYKDRMLFLRGIDNKMSDLSEGNGHQTKETTALTAQPNGRGPSFDQVLSDRIRAPGQRSSLNLAAGPSKRQRLYAGPGDQIESQGDPRRVMDSLFSGVDEQASGEELAKLKLRRESILDAVRDNFKHFEKNLGNEDKKRLDLHAEKLRELEIRLEQQTKISCSEPDVSYPSGFKPAVDQKASAEIQIEIIAMAFACNLTPVATLEFTDGHDPAMFSDYSRGFSNWHDMVHTGEKKRGLSGLHNGYRWYSEIFAHLMERLSAIEEAGVPLIDTTAVQWTSDFGYGAGHNGRSVQTIVAGSLGPNVQMGRLLTFTEDVEAVWTKSDWALNNLYVTLLQAFGEDDTTFGDQGGGVKPGPIPGVFG